MEMFTGDHGLQNDVVRYPDTHLAPFTSDHHKITIIPPQPPQKLRPIRSNVRTVNEPQPMTWQPDVGFYNNSESGFGSPDPKDSNLGLLSKACQNQAALRSSPDESSKSQEEAINEPVNKKRKRKRKSRKRLKSLIKRMMDTVMEKQERMHKQLIEILEKKENESIMREEAWKKQEIERAKMNEQARSQEISRSLALISFIQNTLGQEVQIPKPHNALNLLKKGENKKEEKLKFDARWPKSEVQALITARAALSQKFDGKGSKGSIWDDVAAELSSMGYNRTPKKCKEKWDNINKYYRRTVEKGTASKSQVCTYFRELEMLNQTKLSSANSHDENQNTKSLH